MHAILIRLFVVVAALGAGSSASAEVLATDPWIAAAAPGSRALAGYLSLRNTGASDERLLSATSTDFERVELHEVVRQGELTGMQELKTLALPTGATVLLSPGGRHLMLLGPKRELADGDAVTVELKLESGATLAVTLPVRRRPADDHHAH